jgi:glycosyltransferase involved in cell wall biosynthesis
MNNVQQAMYVPQMQSIAVAVNKRPKLVQCIQMHNEEEFAHTVLSSIYKEVDRIIVIEGAVKNRPNATEDGHSTDRTIEIIEEFKANQDPDNKVTFVKINKHWEHLEEIKQTFLDLCFPGDWIIINDADELYRPEDIRRLRQAIELNPHACEFVPNFLHFYGDFNHLAVPGPEWQPQHQRVFKYTQGMKYVSHPVVTDSAGRCTYFSPEYQARRVMLNDFFIYHYGYARANMDEIMRAKQEYYKGELAKHGGADKKFDQKMQDWFDRTEPVLEFDGTHPEGIKLIYFENRKLALFDRGKVVGNWRDDEFYSKALKEEEYGNIWLCMTQRAQPHMSHYHNGMHIDVS